VDDIDTLKILYQIVNGNISNEVGGYSDVAFASKNNVISINTVVEKREVLMAA